MSKKPRRTINDEIAHEQTVEILRDIRTRLIEGARGAGAFLTQEECQKLIAAGIKEPPRPMGPPVKVDDAPVIAFNCFLREAKGAPVKNAVADTASEFRVSISKVYAARKKALQFKSK